jgi:hypothetical protein
VVCDPPKKRFLVVFNPRWGGYTFPLRRKRRPGGADAIREREYALHDARQALLSDLGPTLGRTAEAHWMDRIEVPGVSGRTEEPTLYIYDIVTLLLAQPVPEGVFAGPYGWLSAEEIRQSDPEASGPNRRMVTWTTWQVLTKLLDNQHVAAAVILREGAGEREYLMTRNRHGEWFFPSTRMGDQVPADQIVVYEFKLKADYAGRIKVDEYGQEVEMDQESVHIGPRSYTFHLRRARFPQEDLTLPGNNLETALYRAGIDFCWMTETDLKAPHPNLSGTVAGLLAAVLQLS